MTATAHRMVTKVDHPRKLETDDVVEVFADEAQGGDVLVEAAGERTVDSTVSDGALVWVDFTDRSHARFAADCAVTVRRS